ncbi:unnamed protein product [Clonostachys rosea f. rosea IK726]|uniref:Zn(2)-C6 fungal-type domain-containing protein n=2 Tax=Bionectria ochroleuca TaxID=29856 RepID=A0A0B7K787_BIOOC|nr:unnamed protein product [Clonostachys rosea f. rosea IK726]
MPSKSSRSRKHRFVNRNRSGCSTCKERHVRCDEARPVCANCINLGRTCNYLAPALPLWDRRRLNSTLPGVHIPWQVSECPVDPFSSLPIEMPYKSRELLHHYVSVCGGTNDSCAEPNIQSIKIQDPTELRLALLISALHYSWKTKESWYFQPTYLFHKIECIGLANAHLKSLKTTNIAVTVRLISTLCIFDSSFGNLDAARAHFDGLMAVLDLIEAQDGSCGVRQVNHDDLIARYIALAHEFVYTATGYLHQRVTKLTQLMGSGPSSKPKDTGIRLDGLRLIPYFTGDPRHAKNTQEQVNLSYDLVPLKVLTPLARERYCSRLCYFMDEFLYGDDPPSLPADCLTSIKQSVLEATKSELRATYNLGTRSLGSFFWSSIAPAGSMYVNNVEADLPANDCHVYSELYLRLTRDIDSTEGIMRAGAESHKIWLWKVFTGAYTIAKTQLAVEDVSGRAEDDSSPFQMLRLWFGQRILSWSRRAHVVDWKDAREALSAVSWPEDSAGAGLSEKLWQEAVWGNTNKQRFDIEGLLVR